MIAFSCQVCGKQIKVDEQYAGKKGKCSACGQTLVIPAAPKTVQTVGSSSSVQPGTAAPAGMATFECPKCLKHIKFGEQHAGTRVKCPACGQALIIPAASVHPSVSEAVAPTTVKPGQPVAPAAHASVTTSNSAGPTNHLPSLAEPTTGVQPNKTAEATEASTIDQVSADKAARRRARIIWLYLAGFFVVLFGGLLLAAYISVRLEESSDSPRSGSTGENTRPLLATDKEGKTTEDTTLRSAPAEEKSSSGWLGWLFWLAFWGVPAVMFFCGFNSDVNRETKHYGSNGSFIGTSQTKVGEEWNEPSPILGWIWTIGYPIGTMCFGLVPW